MIYGIDEFRIDTESLSLARNGEPIALPKRAFDALRFFLENRDRALERGELIKEIWGHEDISDNQLSQIVLCLRRSLGDSGTTQHLIRTIPGHGYQWVGAVEIIHTSEAEESDRAPGADDSSAGRTEVEAPGTASSSEDYSARPDSSNDLDSSDVKSDHSAANQSDSPAESDSSLTQPRTPGRPHRARLPRSVATRRFFSWTPLVIFAVALSVLPGSAMWETDFSPLKHELPIQVAVLPAKINADLEHSGVPNGVTSIVEEQFRKNGFRPIPPAHGFLNNGDSEARVNPSTGQRENDVPEDYFSVSIQANQDQGKWNVRLDVQRPDQRTIRIERSEYDLIEAAMTATDALLIRLEYVPADSSTSNENLFVAVEEWIRQGKYELAASAIDSAPASMQSTPGAILLKAELALAQGRFEEALTGAKKVLDSRSPERDSIHASKAALLRATVHRELRRQPDLAAVDDAIQTLGQSGSTRALADALYQRGRFLVRIEADDQAQINFVRARELYLDQGDMEGAAYVLYELARMRMARGDYSRALDKLDEVKKTFADYGNTVGLAKALQLETSLHSRLSRWKSANSSCEKGLALISQQDRLPWQERMLRRCIHVKINIGQFSIARDLVQRIARVHEQLGPLERNSVILDYFQAQLDMSSGKISNLVQTTTELALDYFRILEDAERSEVQMQKNMEKILLLAVKARKRAAHGDPLPEQLLDRLRNPISSSGTFAKAIYMLEAGQSEAGQSEGESELRKAMTQAKRDHYCALMVEIADVLVSRLIDQGRVADARSELDLLLATDPKTLEGDFQTAVISMRVARAENAPSDFAQALQRAKSLAGERDISGEFAAL